MSKLFSQMSNFVRRKPLLFNSITYGTFYTFAEFSQQTYNRKLKTQTQTQTQTQTAKDLSGDPADKILLFVWLRKFNETFGLLDDDTATGYNWPRIRRYAIYGCFIAGPILHTWYKWLDTRYISKSMKVILFKLIADQFILTPPLICVFFTSMSLMEGKQHIFEECRAKFVKTFEISCLYWLPVQFLNFVLVPPALRVTYVSVAALCWMNILCYLKSMPLTVQEDKLLADRR